MSITATELKVNLGRNVEDYTKSFVKVYEPSTFLKLLESEKGKGSTFTVKIRRNGDGKIQTDT